MEETTVASEYEGDFAVLYDLLHPAAPEAPAYVRLAQAHGGRVLELGGGSGRLLVPLARSGVEAWGLDRNEAMLARCRLRLAEEVEAVRRRVALVRGDMRDFDLGRTFPLVTAPCNVLDLLVDAEDLVRTFACVTRHLDPGGLFVIDGSAPDVPAMVRLHDREQVQRFERPDGRRWVSRFVPRFDFVRQVEEDEILLEEWEGEQPIRRSRTTMTVTWRHPREIHHALARAGLRILGLYGSLDGRRPLGLAPGDLVVHAARGTGAGGRGTDPR